MQQIINQIIILGLLGLTGFIAGRSKYLPDNSGIVLSRIVIKLTAPFLIFTTLASRSFTPKALSDGLIIYILGIAFILLAYIAAYVVSPKLGLHNAAQNVYKMQSMFGNVIFLAFPLIRSLPYGENGIAYAIFYNLANDTVLWTLGIYLVNKHNTIKWKDNLKHLINGNTIAFALGIITILLNLQYYVKTNSYVSMIYSVFYKTFNPLGETTIYLSMIFIGLILSETKIGGIQGIMQRRSVFVLSFFKLILIPGIAVAILYTIGRDLNYIVKDILIIQLAMPCGTIVAALAAQYESDYKYATEGVFVSTILSIITIPVVVLILNMLH